MKRTRLVLLSAVGGGPLERLSLSLNATGQANVHVQSMFSNVGFKTRRGRSRFQAAATRFVMLVLYPWYALSAARRNDLVVATTNPFWLPNILVATRRLHRRPVVTLVYDLILDALEMSGESPSLLARLLRRLTSHWLHRSDAVVFISEEMRDQLLLRYGKPKNSSVISTGVDVSEFRCPVPQPDLEAWLADRKLVSYVGNAGRVHDIDAVVTVIEHALETAASDVAVFISATGNRAAELTETFEGRPRVRIESALDDARWRWVQAHTDVAIITLRAQTAIASMPSRYFSALGSACAVCVVAPPSSDLYRLTEEHEVGAVSSCEHPRRAVQGMTRLLNDPEWLAECQARAHELATRDFDMPVVAQRWLELFARLLGTDPGTTNANNGRAPSNGG